MDNLNLINLEQIKSGFILKKIFNNLEKGKFLEIIKKNKATQKRVNICINDYKEYSEMFSPIEIELKLVYGENGNFINIINKDEESYFHIFFDDNKKEVERNYVQTKDKISKVKIIIDSHVYSFHKLFEDCRCIKSIFFIKFHRKNINNMSFMFSGCSSLKTLNLSNFHTENVTDMKNMFYGCSSLKELNLSSFITNNVTDMSWMFLCCTSLKKLNLSSFITDNVTDMSLMFSKCSSLELYVSRMLIIKNN